MTPCFIREIGGSCAGTMQPISFYSAAAAAARGGLSLQAGALCLCCARLTCRRKRGIARRLNAGWHSDDRLLCLGRTLLRLLPPLRATWALKGGHTGGDADHRLQCQGGAVWSD
jgi:hypothetical protein